MTQMERSPVFSIKAFVFGAKKAKTKSFYAYFAYFKVITELLVLITNVLSSGLHHEGIFRVPGSQMEVNNLKEAFERGTPVCFLCLCLRQTHFI